MGPATDPFIVVDSVSKSFGSLTAVTNISFHLEKGKILGVLGSDGAGKTTLLRMIATMVKPTAGKITVDGKDVVARKSEVKKMIGYMPQRFGLYQDLTVSENLDFFMDIYGIRGNERKRRKNDYLGFSNLLPFMDRPAGDLSGGMKQKLGLACVLVHQPSVLILDEPTNGVDPVSRREFWTIINRMKTDGMTILVSTAYMDEGESCDRLMLAHDSRMLEFSTPRNLQGHCHDLEEAVIRRIETIDKALLNDCLAT
jgi:ABC-2 type transport system ATP-binding protein